MRTDKLAVASAYAAMCAIWGTTWLAIKIGLHALPPLTGVGLRFLIAGAFLYIVAALRGQVRPLVEVPWRLVTILSVFLFGLNYALIYAAETKLDSGLVAVLFGLLPFFSFAFARAMLGERTAPRIWFGAAAALCGVGVIALGGSAHGAPLFALAAVAAAASSSYANVYAKRCDAPPLMTLPPAMVIAGGVVLTLGLYAEHTAWASAFTTSSVAALLYLAICGSGIAFFLLLWLLQRLPAGTVALATLTYPVIAIAAGAFFGNEHLSVREAGGAGLVLAGLWVARRPDRRD